MGVTRFSRRQKSQHGRQGARSLPAGRDRYPRSAARSRQAGIAKTAREEKKRARDSKAESNKVKNDAAYDARMAQLYREVVLKESRQRRTKADSFR